MDKELDGSRTFPPAIAADGARAPRSRAEAWTQRVNGLVELPGLLRGFGIDPRGLLEHVGLPPDALDSANGRIPFTKAVLLVTESVRQSGCPHLGIIAGRRWRLEHMGIIGELVRQCPTVGEGLRTFVVNQRLYSQGLAAYLFEYPVSAELGFAIYHPDVEDSVAVYDMTLAALLTSIDELCGRDWRPTEVLLPHARPRSDRPYTEAFRCQVTFDADRAAVRFPRHMLQWPVLGADPGRHDSLELEASASFDQHLLPLLYRSLRLLMVEGNATLPSLARQFAMHHRTLDRRLRMQGTSFKQILDDVRYETARTLLRHSRKSIGEISAALGYSEDSAFVRAFHRWSGTSPGQWRATHVSPEE